MVGQEGNTGSSDLGGTHARFQREAAARGLVLRAVRGVAGRTPGPSDLFLVRRATGDVRSFSHAREQRCALRLLDLALTDGVEPGEMVSVLVEWGGLLEASNRLCDAAEALTLATALAPADPEVALHRARTERKRGRLVEARALYDRVATLAGGDPAMGLMAAVGRALTSDDVEDALGRVLRGAVQAGVREAAAVAQEERARVRRARGDVQGAVRDYLAAAARHEDAMDRGRIGHELADLLVGAGDLEGARSALIETLRLGHPEQIALAQARLRTIARAQGDEVGLRRYGPEHAPALVSLAPAPGRTRARASAPGDPSIHRAVRRGFDRISSKRSGR